MNTLNQNDKRLQILEAAQKMVAEVGIQGISMKKLADEAGVAAGTIYRYFDDKDHLLEELRLYVVSCMAKAVQLGVDADKPLKVQYRTMWLNIWRLAASNFNSMQTRAQYDSIPSKNSAETREQERKLFAQVDNLFSEGKKQGVFKDLDNEILSGLSLEASVSLARKHALGLYQLDENALESAIEASWDAIIKH
ncbi:TetR family transcriptional regulator [Vibrio sp. 10N.286.49.C2]|uniref:TetR/AcrR family transcriptional regulator n=1 Tax=unclassified Vibrio TaxID=2614977 RepID=UPI000C82F85E|nr:MULTISPECIES: TetR/AcrR family transcriptional regulator [unclassified Vibrio]PMH37309.1 TetR family transcriptional regulator [Vibrio sp. 10N.286.49.C2]PMH49397.1 TetR family transcriptional regulator [Vibrio sp. 10N.286.49.B1]PMH80779.1 TetR family transcriptional regulator [Vibrio sp. 10N.286.48.B7]